MEVGSSSTTNSGSVTSAARDPHPLLLARGEVRRIVVEDVGGEAHALQHRGHARPALGARHAVQRERLVHRLIGP